MQVHDDRLAPRCHGQLGLNEPLDLLAADPVANRLVYANREPVEKPVDDRDPLVPIERKLHYGAAEPEAKRPRVGTVQPTGLIVDLHAPEKQTFVGGELVLRECCTDLGEGGSKGCVVVGLPGTPELRDLPPKLGHLGRESAGPKDERRRVDAWPASVLGKSLDDLAKLRQRYLVVFELVMLGPVAAAFR